MRGWASSCVSLAILACGLAAPAAARAALPQGPEGPAVAAAPPSEPAPTQAVRPRRERVRALELQALGMTQLLPKPGVGADVAFAFGHPNFQARVGVMAVGVPGFRLGGGEVVNVLQVGTLDGCAAKRVLHHQIRMCVGGQAGAMAHVWKGFDPPRRPLTLWAAGTLRGDYQVLVTKRLGIIGGVGMVIPLVGPTFSAVDDGGSTSPLVFPGPIAGYLSLGTALHW
jgi:hypothetical protein